MTKFLQFIAETSQKSTPQTPKRRFALIDSSSPHCGDIGGVSAPREGVDNDRDSAIKRRRLSSPPASPSPSFPHHQTVFQGLRQPLPPPPRLVSPDLSKPACVPAKNTQHRRRKPTKAQEKAAAGRIQVAHKTWVDEVVTVTSLQADWPVPRSGKTVAIVVDLTQSTVPYLDNKGEPLSMANIIKNKVFFSPQ